MTVAVEHAHHVTNATGGTAVRVLAAISVSHLLNDTIQSLIPAIYPIIKQSYQLDYIQIGLITLTFQVSASLLQPLVGFVTDRHPMPYSMVAGMACSLIGLIALAHAGSYGMLLAASACVGLGSSIFHPEATRTARNASGGQHGFAQRSFRSEVRPAARLDRCSRLSSSCRAGKPA
jgi:FSR family fosmidomycin resistance protein-like MFS transporter